MASAVLQPAAPQADDLDRFMRPPAVGPVRVLYVVGGLGFVGMAYLGAVLPGLPTTPWVLLASYCFARSSRRMQRWLLQSPFFGRLLRDWHDHRGMRPAAKRLASVMVIAACSFSVAFAPAPLWVKGCIAGGGVVGLTVILGLVPTVRPGDRRRCCAAYAPAGPCPNCRRPDDDAPCSGAAR